MDINKNENNQIVNSNNFILIFISGILLCFNYYFVYFINSSFLSSIIDERYVSSVFAIGAILNIIIFTKTPKILAKIGNFKLSFYLSIAEIAVLAGMAMIHNIVIVLILFTIHQIASPILLYTLDIFLEKFSPITEMGSIRGTYLAITNIPPAVTPFIVGLLLTANSDYGKVYLIAAAFLIPFLAIIVSNFKKFEDPVYSTTPYKYSIRNFMSNQNLNNIFKDHFLLHLFYSAMVIYMPIYLNKYIGFDWPEIGLMFSIMLLPFILFQYPLGRIEDRLHDEKTVLIAGFMIMAGSSILIPFITGQSFILWTGILFISRIGASFVEVSGESYFFKHIRAENASYVSIFRMTRTLPFLIMPIIALPIVFLFGMQYIFLAIGIIVFFGGLRYTFRLK
jgi:MFS family permease